MYWWNRKIININFKILIKKKIKKINKAQTMELSKV